jgi:hypothetical protein
MKRGRAMRKNSEKTLTAYGAVVALAVLLGLFVGRPAAAALVDCGAQPNDPLCLCTVSPSDPKCLGNVTYAVNTAVDLPADGKLYYGTLTVNSGVTVSFNRNTLNTPVFILAGGNVAINGYVFVNAPDAGTPGGATHVGIAGDAAIGDDGIAGVGAPGGFAGGVGGRGGTFGGSEGASGGWGRGPGGGGPGSNNWNDAMYSAGGAGYNGGGGARNGAVGGAAYGQDTLQPLVGGSGGGGGGGGSNFNGAGGGGGGGALLIASNTSVAINGSIQAQGARGGNTMRPDSYPGHGGAGGGGSGGALRIVADSITGGGSLYAQGAWGGVTTGWTNGDSYAGAYGRIRLEAKTTFSYTGSSSPGRSFGVPGPIFVPNDPTLRIASVAGSSVPATPTGVDDVVLPQGTTTGAVVLTGHQIPLGTTVTVVVKGQTGNQTSVTSPALAGTLDNSTATVQVTLPAGPSIIEARCSFTLVLSGGFALLKYGGEEVKTAEVQVGSDGKNQVTYVTSSGRRVPEKEIGPLAYALNYVRK